MKTVILKTKNIKSKTDFHKEFKKIMGFPDFYGMNWDAWNDCMGDVRDPDTGMTSVHIGKNEMLYIHVTEVEDFIKRLPKVFEDFVSCTAFVNEHIFLRYGEKPAIALVFLDKRLVGSPKFIKEQKKGLLDTAHKVINGEVSVAQGSWELYYFLTEIGEIGSKEYKLFKQLTAAEMSQMEWDKMKQKMYTACRSLIRKFQKYEI
ncbi:MAG TPA: barstar family protein [Candidatus Nitrosocosmicus sp.]|nr:barstar family protein [Candidatus Nitrosocosmicus sp.]